MESIINLFKGELLTPTLIVSFASFLAGLLVEMAVIKLMSGRKAAPGQKRVSSRLRPDSDRARPDKRHPAPADGSVEIYVGNLSYDMPEDALRKEFEAFGKVNSARIITNKFNNRSKGFGFVQMPVRSEAEAAVKAIDGKEMFGRCIKCNEARNLV